jgi:hypothetical protein
MQRARQLPGRVDAHRGKRIGNMNALRQRAPWRGSRPRDVTCQTRTLATSGADATARISGLLARRPRPLSGMLWPTHRRRQPVSGPAGSALMTSRRAGTTASAVPSRISSGRGGSGLGWGGAGARP